MNRNAKILIVDDEYDKVLKVIALTKDSISADFEHVSNSREALTKLKTEQYDLIIIDLQIPEFLGEDINPHGGRDLLEYIDGHDDLLKPTHILGITSHKDSYDECQSSFYDKGWSLICGIDDEDLIKGIIKAKVNHAVNPPDTYDVAIVTALEPTELQAVLNWPCNWIPVKDNNDSYIYYSGTIDDVAGKCITLIASSCHHMGIAEAAALGMKICLKYTPDYVFMTGIAAGIEGKVELGDILVADLCWDWGNGKQTIRDGKPVFLSAPRQQSLDPCLRAKLKNISTERRYLDEIYNSWPIHNRPKTALNVHVGPIATGAVVLEDPSVVEMIKSQHRETIGIEMEAYGLVLSTHMSSTNPPKAVVIKSVCDFADPQKNNDFQSYAAYTSSQLAFKFIVHDLYV